MVNTRVNRFVLNCVICVINNQQHACTYYYMVNTSRYTCLRYAYLALGRDIISYPFNLTNKYWDILILVGSFTLH